MATAAKGHWVLDNPVTNHDFQIANDEVIDLVESKLNQHLDSGRKIPLQNTKIPFIQQGSVSMENSTLESKPHDIDLSLPILSSKYNIQFDKDYSTKSQRWKGVVKEVKKDEFIAELTDLINPTTIEIESFEFNEISPGDRELINLGNVFYWSICYIYNKGQLNKESIIRFQRLSKWTERDYDYATDRAKELSETLKWG